ncbi:MAG: ElyC/SanA/YdcF family protein [Cyanobacteria bacterium P01_F01_bin.86]
MQATKQKNLVVVPDGISIVDGQVVPSFVYRAVLDEVASKHSGEKIYLAPANDFGTGVKEQEVARDYLSGLNGRLDVICVEADAASYIDTRGNAHYFKRYLIERGVKASNFRIVLIAAKRHLRRAIVCFEKEGFAVEQVHSVEYQVARRERIVSRLFYYKYPFVHSIYEILATIRDRLKC